MGGIHGGNLTGQRLGIRCVGRAAAPRGAHHTHTCAEDDDAGEKQQRFSFGGGWHGDKFVSSVTNRIICLFQGRLILRTNSIMFVPGARDWCTRRQ